MADITSIERYKKFTDEDYLSQEGVRRKVSFVLLEKTWDAVLAYREMDGNREEIDLPGLASGSFVHYTTTPALRANYADFERLLQDFKTTYRSLSDDPEMKEAFLRRCYGESLNGFAKLESIDFPEASLKAVLGAYFSEKEGPRAPVFNYYQLFAFFGDIYEDPECQSASTFFPAVLESIFEEGSATYRNSDPHRAYLMDAAPRFLTFSAIDERMKDLWAVLQDEKIPAWARALLASFYIAFAKPFPVESKSNHNAVAGILLARRVLMDSEFAEIATIVPLETILDLSAEFIASCDLEIRKSADATYYFLYAISRLSRLLTDILDDIQQLRASEIRHEAIAIPQEEIDQIRPGEETLSAEEEEAAPAPVPEPEPVKKPERKRSIDSVPEAIDYVPPSKSREALIPSSKKEKGQNPKEIARYLLETHPLIRRPQANFYATHRTQGRYYTIQDYKKSIHCAYETARTSMELLASEGLYTKLRVKNKFVYTPTAML